MAILITGASAGFGADMARVFVKAGYAVIGVARRQERLQALKEELGDLFEGVVMDITQKDSVLQALAKIDTLPEHFAKIDCLINNAGLALGLDKAQEANFDDWEVMMQTNIIGLAFLTHQILPKMVAQNEGYIINLGSIAGNYAYPGGNIYGASKAFVRQFSMNLRADLYGTPIRVSNIEPGLVGGSEFSYVRFKGDQARADSLYENASPLQSIDIANTALWLYETPKHMNVNSIEIMPVTQSFSALDVYKNAASNDTTQPENESDSDSDKGLWQSLRKWWRKER